MSSVAAIVNLYLDNYSLDTKTGRRQRQLKEAGGRREHRVLYSMYGVMYLRKRMYIFGA
jgi:hypothetical protein